MSRLSSAEKLHFYPLHPNVTALLTRFVTAPHGGRLLDPCAGEGVALTQLAQAWRIEPFGVELHPERADVARSAVDIQIANRPALPHQDRHVTRLFAGSMQFMNISRGGFNCILNNPPFDFDEADKRREV